MAKQEGESYDPTKGQRVTKDQFSLFGGSDPEKNQETKDEIISSQIPPVQKKEHVSGKRRAKEGRNDQYSGYMPQ